MALLLDGNSEIDAHVSTEIGNLICLWLFFNSTEMLDLKYITKYYISFARFSRITI